MTFVADATVHRAAAARTARPALARALRRFFRTPKGLMLLVLALLAALAAPRAGLATVAPGLLVAMAGAALLDAPLLRLTRGEWQAPSGALLSALFVALVLDPHEPWYVPLCTAILAVNSKYLFRTRWANVFNPAAIALVANYFLFGSGQSWWGALPDLPLPFLAVLLATVADPAGVPGVFRVPTPNAPLFFVGFLLGDPPTSPARQRDQLVYGGIVA